MMRIIASGLMLWLLFGAAGASRAVADNTHKVEVVSGGAYSEALLKREVQGVLQEIELRKIDEKAFGYARAYEAGEHAAQPGPGPDGRVQFVYGSTLVRVFCLVQSLCDIELQQGETLNGKPISSNQTEFLGNTTVANGRPHVAVQPVAANVKTTLLIPTNRRMYSIEVIGTADPEQHMGRVGFVYPDEDQEQRWHSAMEEHGQRVGPDRDERPGYIIEADPDQLHLNYRISDNCGFWWWKRCKWQPVHVYDDGEKTIIEMPWEMLVQDAPLLFVSVPGHKMAQVSFHQQGRYFVMHRLFERAYLIKGRGWHQERVEITRLED